MLATPGAACRRRPPGSSSATRHAGSVARTDWGLLPRTSEALRTRLARERARPAAESVTIDVAGIERALSDPRAVGGRDAIIAHLRGRIADANEVYLLLGVFHDARAHVDAFRTLVLALPFTHAFAEPLAAASGFRDAAHDGDDRLLARFRQTGARADLAAFEALHRTHDATGVKFDWVGDLVQLVAAARGIGVPLLGCDQPREVRPVLPDDEVMRVRELHCALAMRDALRSSTGPRRVAVMWGDARRARDAPRAAPRPALGRRLRAPPARRADRR